MSFASKFHREVWTLYTRNSPARPECVLWMWCKVSLLRPHGGSADEPEFRSPRVTSYFQSVADSADGSRFLSSEQNKSVAFRGSRAGHSRHPEAWEAHPQGAGTAEVGGRTRSPWWPWAAWPVLGGLAVGTAWRSLEPQLRLPPAPWAVPRAATRRRAAPGGKGHRHFLCESVAEAAGGLGSTGADTQAWEAAWPRAVCISGAAIQTPGCLGPKAVPQSTRCSHRPAACWHGTVLATSAVM